MTILSFAVGGGTVVVRGSCILETRVVCADAARKPDALRTLPVTRHFN